MVPANVRQQLSCDSKELLERCVLAELRRLQALRDDVCALRVDRLALARVDALIEKAHLALRQLGYVYLDQFEKGRQENDEAGRLGLHHGQPQATPEPAPSRLMGSTCPTPC